MNKIFNVLIIVVILGGLILVAFYQENKIDDVVSLKEYYSTLSNFNCQKEDCFSVENKIINDRQVIVTRKLHFEFRKYYISFRDYRSFYDSYYSFDEDKLYFEVTIDNYEFTGNYNVRRKKFDIKNNNPNTSNPEILEYYKTLENQIQETSLNVIDIINSDISESIK